MTVPHRILLALDGSTCAAAAAKIALQLAVAMPVELTAVHVVNVTTPTGDLLYDLPHRMGFEPAVVTEQIFQQHVDAGEKVLAAFEKEARERGIACECRTLVGAVGASLLSAARHADLLVVGLKGETEDRFPGQGGARIASFLNDITVPVLVVPKACTKLSSVALGYDGSVGAAHAVSAVRRFMTPLGLKVHAIHIGEDATILHEVNPNLKGLAITHHVIAGADPHEVLAKTANEKNADVLALGFRGRSRMKDFLFGSATEFIALNTKLALLVTH